MKTRLILTACAGLLAVGATSCGKKPAPAAEAPHEIAPKAESGQLTVRVATVQRRDLEQTIEASGRLVLREEATVGTELSGFRVAEVMADVGDWVKKGQPLARLDSALLQAEIAQAEAALVQQDAAADFKEAQLARAENLGEAGAMSQETIDSRRLEAIQARASYTASLASVNEMKVRQARMVLRAPVAGPILARNINPGDIASAGGAPYFRIARDGLVEVEAELSDSRLPHVKVGQKAIATLPTGESFVGKVRYVSPTYDKLTGLGQARVELPYNELLRAGTFAEVSFETEQDDVLSVEASAIRYESGGPVLMRLDEENRLQAVRVKIGDRMGDYVSLSEGASEGDRVLLFGASFALQGDVVTPAAPGAGTEGTK